MSAAEPLILLDNVTRTYRMGKMEVQALRGISLSVLEAEFVAIMGGSVSSKFTLMYTIGCLDRPASARCPFAGREVSRLTREELAVIRNRTLGFVFQNFNLLARTSALENVELPLLYAGVSTRERARRAKESLSRVGLADRLDHHPGQLSGGQQQRVAIARALVTRPRVILADEPTGNIDSRASVEIMSLFQELGRSGITIVLVTHEADIASYATRVVRMKDGLVISDKRQAQAVARLEEEPVEQEVEG